MGRTARRVDYVRGMLLLSFLACQHHVAEEGPGPAEDELRSACAGGGAHAAEACGALVVLLESGEYGADRARDALSVAERNWRLDANIAHAGLLIADAHPELPTMDFWAASCQTGIDWTCDHGGDRLYATDPAGAQALWKKGCERGLSWLCGRTAPVDTVPSDLPPAFAAALAHAHASLHLPPGYHSVPVAPSEDFQTDYAVMSADGGVEMRFAVRDMGELIGQLGAVKQDGGAVADFGKIEQSQVYVTLANVGTMGVKDVTAGFFPKIPVRVEFNANWGMNGATRARPSFSADGALVMLSFFHRDPGVDLYAFGILHDPLAMEKAWSQVFHSLRFDDGVGLGGSWSP